MNTKKLLVVAAAFAAFNVNAALTFSEGAAGNYGGPIDFTSTSGNVTSPVAGSITNVWLAPLTLSGTDPYSVISTGGSATIAFGTGVSSFSFLWGSPDTYNFLDIATNDLLLPFTFSGSDLGVLANPDFTANGNNANTRLFTIGTNDGTLIESITFRSDGVAFEVAAAIPEPSTYALMIAGLAAVGFVARRRKS
ncbi:MAG: PEP-CTERM sorting domain-containing protein [Methylibium sp.]|uniref:Npun_F0296 family exosortase-dependent surface protein n=1 Tax=Methylibium sp. TaxID=2067992 RepID=UPI001852E60C|nr:PEP-CTERM sorting domain-containing protein [Methylibium sp.]MBA2722646.1 PEP-CTERM sorting domain-containing protein [Methylibium sp.]MBA3590662.1 PEP-CTERM sorting domain-containing protein [Methylibium sp.]MBA3625842.1 PEP-CTERM sorting domain-containing protein [Methylibium sp.]